MFAHLFDPPPFIRPYNSWPELRPLRIGLTGAFGVLGRVLTSRFDQNDIHYQAYPGDITDEKDLRQWFSGRRFDAFFHFAAIVPVTKVNDSPMRAFEVNAIGAFRVAQRIVEASPECWTFLASTSHVYQPLSVSAVRPLRVGECEAPASLYGRTKLAGEHLCRQLLEAFRLPYCIARIFSFSHRLQQEPYLVPRLTNLISHLPDGAPLKLMNAASVRDILDAETVVDAILHLAARQFRGTVNVGSGTGITIAEIAQRVATSLGKTLRIENEEQGAPDALVADVVPLQNALAP